MVDSVVPINPGQSNQSSSADHDRSRDNRTPIDQLDRLRQMRVRPDRARGIGSDLALEMKSMKQISSSEASAAQAWATTAPDAVNASTRVVGLKAGKLIVHVPSAAHRYVVDRWLKSGGMSSLQSLARTPIRGVSTQIKPESFPNE